MPIARILSATLVLLAFVMGLRHGVGLLRSTPAQVQDNLHISLSQPTILILGFLTCVGAILVVFPLTFFAANVISAGVILYLAAVQSGAHNLRGALAELPFVVLPLLVLYLGYPFQHQPQIGFSGLHGETMKLKDKTILITGGTSGIGLEFAKKLLTADNTVLITGRDSKRIQTTQQLLPDVHVFQSDASEPSAIGLLQREVLAKFPKVSVIINNAGIMRNLNLTVTDPSDVTSEIAVCLSGPILLNQLFLPHLLKQKESLIVNVSSGLALIPFTISPVYSAAKAGLHAYTKCLRYQMKGTSVRVIELLPPGTETPLFREEFEKEMKDQKGMDVTALVKQAIAGIEANQDEIRPGLTKVLGVMSRVAPNFMMAQIAKMSAPKP